MEIQTCKIILDSSNKELNIQGDIQLPVAIYNDDLKQCSVPYHWHEELELIVVEKGEMELVIEFEKYHIKQGESIFINASRMHSCTYANNSNCTIKSIVFDARFIYGELQSIIYEKYFYTLLQDSSDDIIFLNNHISNELEEAYRLFASKEFAYEFKVRQKLTDILIYVISESKKNPTTKVKNTKQLQRCKQMILYIQQSFHKEVTLANIAASANIKESECLRCFKAVLHTSPIRYLKKYRLQQAAILLLTTNHTIIDIAMACGFLEVSYFSKSFKEMYHLTPSQYRNNKE